MKTKSYKKGLKVIIGSILLTVTLLSTLLLTSCNNSKGGNGCNSGGGVCKASNIQLRSE